MTRRSLGFVGSATLAVAVSAGTGCATRGDLDDLRLDMLRIAARQDSLLMRQQHLIESLRSETALTRDTLRTQSDQLFGFRGDIANSLRKQDEVLTRIEMLVGQGQSDISSLRSEVEELRSAISYSPRSTTGASVPYDGPSVGNSAADVTSMVSTDEPAELYSIAMQMIDEGSLGTARMALDELLQTSPNHALAPEAWFKLADIIEQEGDLEGALKAYSEIRSRFPTAARVPDALYRVALIQLELGERADAIETLELIVNTYSDALFAEVAADKLAEIRQAFGDAGPWDGFPVARALSRV